MSWEALTAISTAVSALALLGGIAFVTVELRHIEKDRYVAIVAEVFRIWQSPDFLQDQFWLLHHVHESSWEMFLQSHDDDAERIFFRVGAYYNHIGSLLFLRLLDDELLLPSIAASALAVWRVLEPLVQDLRRMQGSQVFADYETMLPSCRNYLIRRRHSMGKGSNPAADVSDSLPRTL